jgi:heavy metal efflux system protein
VGVAVLSLRGGRWLASSGIIGSEFLPHLDEGAIWARGTLAPSTGPDEGTRLMNQARLVLASFPEVTQVVSQVGRPTMAPIPRASSTPNTFVDLKPKDQWRPVFKEDKDELIAAMDREWRKSPACSGISRSRSPTTWKKP